MIEIMKENTTLKAENIQLKGRIMLLESQIKDLMAKQCGPGNMNDDALPSLAPNKRRVSFQEPPPPPPKQNGVIAGVGPTAKLSPTTRRPGPESNESIKPPQPASIGRDNKRKEKNNTRIVSAPQPKAFRRSSFGSPTRALEAMKAAKELDRKQDIMEEDVDETEKEAAEQEATRRKAHEEAMERKRKALEEQDKQIAEQKKMANAARLKWQAMDNARQQSLQQKKSVEESRWKSRQKLEQEKRIAAEESQRKVQEALKEQRRKAEQDRLAEESRRKAREALDDARRTDEQDRLAEEARRKAREALDEARQKDEQDRLAEESRRKAREGLEKVRQKADDTGRNTQQALEESKNRWKGLAIEEAIQKEEAEGKVTREEETEATEVEGLLRDPFEASRRSSFHSPTAAVMAMKENNKVEVPNFEEDLESDKHRGDIHVGFRSMRSLNEVHEYISRQEMTDEEKTNAFFSKAEMKAIKEHPRTRAFIISKMSKKGGGFFAKKD